ncbi:hypothetical protein DRO26_01660 [Candidatus Bathyarchaeota archaeon]|nr:MAG: hypothetical protein DRO26_01660 [Candidatus Bathyarchaeota archaeon]
MDEEITVNCKIISIRPFFDGYGNEFVCVEFGVEAQKPPAVMSLPSGLPQEISFLVPILTQIPKMFTQKKIYSKRIVLYLTNQEWERMERKYHYGDEVEVKINRKNGMIKLMLQQQ